MIGALEFHENTLSNFLHCNFAFFAVFQMIISCHFFKPMFVYYLISNLSFVISCNAYQRYACLYLLLIGYQGNAMFFMLFH